MDGIMLDKIYLSEKKAVDLLVEYKYEEKNESKE